MVVFCLYLFVGYLVFVWVVARLTVPHLGFGEDRVPDTLPEDWNARVVELSEAAADDADFLKRAYEFVVRKYSGSRLQTITRFWRAFEDPFQQPPGFMHCTGQNFILRTLLIKSGRFAETDVQVKVVPLNFFIHQYLLVRVDGKWIDVDPWSSFLGVPLGEKSVWLG